MFANSIIIVVCNLKYSGSASGMPFTSEMKGNTEQCNYYVSGFRNLLAKNGLPNLVTNFVARPKKSAWERGHLNTFSRETVPVNSPKSIEYMHRGSYVYDKSKMGTM